MAHEPQRRLNHGLSIQHLHAVGFPSIRSSFQLWLLEINPEEAFTWIICARKATDCYVIVRREERDGLAAYDTSLTSTVDGKVGKDVTSHISVE
jgi:hypothetical protein